MKKYDFGKIVGSGKSSYSDDNADYKETETTTKEKPEELIAKKELFSDSDDSVEGKGKTKKIEKKEKNSKVDKKKIGGKKIKGKKVLDAKKVEKEIKEFHKKPKKVREKESVGFDFGDLTSQIKNKVKSMESSSVKRSGKKSKYGIERVASGIKGLDDTIEGGFEKGSSVLVVGSAGTGKSLFGLQFLYRGAIEHKEPGIFISFEEGKESLYRHSNAFGWDFEKLEKKNLFRIQRYRPHQVEKLMREGGGPIKDLIKKIGAKRLVIDSITSYGLLFKDEYQRRQNILNFFEMLNKWGCTSIIISELPPKLAEIKEGSVGFMTDAIISLYYGKTGDEGVRVHSCEILKMRGTKHTNKLMALGFEEDGLVIYPDVEIF